MSPSSHTLIEFANGSVSLCETRSGEAMHSHIGPWEEANRLYVEQSRLEEKLRSGTAGPLVLYDVGMGIAANSLAALQCHARTQERRPLHLISFERDLSGLELALRNRERFPFFDGATPALEALLLHGRWQSSAVTWELHPAPFESLTLAGLPSPELIYFDFYSPKTCPHLWTEAIFRKLYESTAARRAHGLSTELLTYSSATSIRAALLLAGFHCGKGIATPSKTETTVASTLLSDLKAPLDVDWRDKFMRSSKPLPQDWEMTRFHEARRKIETLPQFKL